MTGQWEIKPYNWFSDFLQNSHVFFAQQSPWNLWLGTPSATASAKAVSSGSKSFFRPGMNPMKMNYVFNSCANWVWFQVVARFFCSPIPVFSQGSFDTCCWFMLNPAQRTSSTKCHDCFQKNSWLKRHHPRARCCIWMETWTNETNENLFVRLCFTSSCWTLWALPTPAANLSWLDLNDSNSPK